MSFAKKDIINNKYIITNIQYRPFDYRLTAYSGVTKGFMAYPREKIMTHLVKDNLAFVTTRINRGLSQGYNFVSRNILDSHLLDSAADSLQSMPLYFYPEVKGQQSIGQSTERIPNLNTEILKQIAGKLGSTFTNEKETTKDTFAPIDLLDYIYAVLHSPAYREKYKEFLKIDFPRVPYPKDADSFWKLVEKGKAIRELHLLESPLLEQRITQYPIAGTNQVGKVRYEDGKVYINELQYFSNVPQIAWEFYIGGYQPAQKWLKDRKDRTLNFEDINHYQYIIIALTETARLMKEIDDLGMEW